MKQDIHPKWYPDAKVICACGNTWTTGATMQEIRTDICSDCHPFYTGEQRIVDTEGRYDMFMRRLQKREEKAAEAEAREAAKTPSDLLLSELEINARFTNILSENGINTVEDFFNILNENGDEGILSMQGIGRKVLSDLKKMLRNRGYEIPETAE
ncbi:MAG: 50S ribosomal protein L31 [Chloroflexota bacterium]